MDQEIRAIRNDADHAWALAEYERFFDGEPQAGTPDADRFEVLGVLIRDYEAERWPVGPSDPIDLIRFAIEDMGRSQADLARILGSRSRASEILARKRGLTLDMIRAIAAEWHLPVEALARPYRLDAAPAPANPSGKVTIRALTRSVKAPSGFSSPGGGPQGCGGASSSPPRGANIAA